MHQVGNQPRLYYNARSTSPQDLTLAFIFFGQTFFHLSCCVEKHFGIQTPLVAAYDGSSAASSRS
jgi:hypothetical protein